MPPNGMAVAASWRPQCGETFWPKTHRKPFDYYARRQKRLETESKTKLLHTQRDRSRVGDACQETDGYRRDKRPEAEKL